MAATHDVDLYLKIVEKTVVLKCAGTGRDLLEDVVSTLPFHDCYILNQGKILKACDPLIDGETYTLCPRLRGGKGGFGSMLRAIGAQIEKTTNREACRDLSGRRMRDVNNEKKMVEFMKKKAEEEREREKKKKEKLERLTQDPKHFFNDPEYDTKVHETIENVDKAVEKGILAHSKKRKMTQAPKQEPKLKKGLWMEDDDLTSDDSDSDTELSIVASKSDVKSKLQLDGASCSSTSVNCCEENDEPHNIPLSAKHEEIDENSTVKKT